MARSQFVRFYLFDNDDCPMGNSLVEGGNVYSRMAFLKLPGLEFLACSVCTQLYFDCAGTEEGRGPAVLCQTHLIVLHTPRLSKFIHVKLNLAIST